MWCCSTTYKSDVDLQGKTAVITGANTGIGLETAKDLYKRGARVLILCRNEVKGNEAIEIIKQERDKLSNNHHDVIFKQMDLGDLESVRKCAKQILREEKHINILINNAGVMTSPEHKTKDGFEIHFGINYLGHFLLTLLLLPKIIKSAPARIVNVSSLAHQFPFIGGRIDVEDLNFEKRTYRQLVAYAQSKLALISFTEELARRLKEANVTTVTTYSLHPGVIATELGRNFSTLSFGFTWLWNKFKNALFKTPKQGAATQLYCAVDEKCANESGLYYSDCKKKSPHRLTHDRELAKQLWTKSIEYVNLENYDPFHGAPRATKTVKV